MVGRAQWLPLSIFILLWITAKPCPAATDVDFRLEFSKPEVYVGEQVLCNFVIYTSEEVLDVEVAKFPEFRGYWKENLALRQGPITGSPVPGKDLYRVTVGTYLLVPMLSQRDAEIQPMKIVAKSSNVQRVEGSSPPEFFLSKGELPKLKELPPLSAEDRKVFTGAVGSFSFYQGDTNINYQRGEPAQFRLTLTGQGNFPELNELPITLPKEMEIVSKRSMMQGTGQFSAKSFEYTVNIHDDKDFTLTPAKLTYFDPDQRKYISLTSPTLQLKFVRTAEPTAEASRQEPQLELPAQHFTRYHRWERTIWFIALNGLIAWILALLIIAKIVTSIRAKRAADPRAKRQARFASATATLKQGDIATFLKEADALAADLLCRRLGLSNSILTRQQLIEEAKKRGLDDAINSIRPIFSAYEKAAFSPSHDSTVDTKALVDELSKLMRESP
jgi:hypothetical protein